MVRSLPHCFLPLIPVDLTDDRNGTANAFGAWRLAYPRADSRPAETLPTAASTDRPSEILQRCGKLDNGSVSDVVVNLSRATILSRMTR
ncbi:MAG TPA: hypothetical protein VGJ20_31595 [Xanthobacteraceae bacterium]